MDEKIVIAYTEEQTKNLVEIAGCIGYRQGVLQGVLGAVMGASAVVIILDFCKDWYANKKKHKRTNESEKKES